MQQLLIFLRLMVTMILLAAIVIMYISIKPLSSGIIKDIYKSILYFSVFILIVQMIVVLFNSHGVDGVFILSSLIMTLLAFVLMISSALRIESICKTFGFESEGIQLNDLIKKSD